MGVVERLVVGEHGDAEAVDVAPHGDVDRGAGREHALE